jgi:hypothetical protein
MTSFRKFWPLYLRAHQHRGTRIGHYYATAIALSVVAVSIVLHTVWLAILGIVVGYGIALTSHRIGAGSRSLVFVNPVWGALADLKMCWLALRGSLSAELARHAAPSRDHGAGAMAESPQ